MAEVLRMKDAELESVMDPVDFSDLVEKYMGTDAKNWFDKFAANYDQCLAELHDHLIWLGDDLK